MNQYLSTMFSLQVPGLNKKVIRECMTDGSRRQRIARFYTC